MINSKDVISLNRDAYIGNTLQICGVEEHRLIGGKSDGMRIFIVRNGLGLEFTISVDRCADISRLSFKGDNYSYFSPAGYVSPQYYDDKENGFIKSFTGGFLTTCGLNAVGTPCTDNGQSLPLHGTVSNTPCEHIYWTEDENEINILATINQSIIFGDKVKLARNICCSKNSNCIQIFDTIKNLGENKIPCMILYHFNIGYPLLTENSMLHIPSNKIVPRNSHSEKKLENWDKLSIPQKKCEEQCYYHTFEKDGYASIYNKDINKGLEMKFDAKALDYFVQWEMMGYKDYVLGLEPGNCHPDGRDKMRKDGNLKFIEPQESLTYKINLNCFERKV